MSGGWDFGVVYFPGLIVFPPVFVALVARTADIAHTSGLVVLAPMLSFLV